MAPGPPDRTVLPSDRMTQIEGPVNRSPTGARASGCPLGAADPPRTAASMTGAPPRAAGPPPSALLSALEAARSYLLSVQQPDGHWVGELEGDTILESEYILLRVFMGNLDAERLRKLVNQIRRMQRPEGGWAIYPGGPVEVSSSVKAYLALKIAGLNPDHPELANARAAILAHGGITACNIFTKIYLAVMGLYPWEGTPVVP